MSFNQLVFSRSRCATTLPCTDALGAHQASSPAARYLIYRILRDRTCVRAAHPKTCLTHHPLYDSPQKGTLWGKKK